MERFFRTEKVTNRITRIAGATEELMYLVEGEEKAALIDTGVGIGNLKVVVESVTDKPVIVILTHGHMDHACGASVFEKVYLSDLDQSILPEPADIKTRMEFCSVSPYEEVKTLTEKDYLPAPEKTQNLEDGMMFDLGGVTLEIHALAGHTPGSMTVLFKEDRILLTGDACNPGTFLFGAECLTVEEYRENLIAFREKMSGSYDRIILSHGAEMLDASLIDDVIDTCDCILAGTSDDMRMDFMGQEAYCAMAVDFENGYKRKDGKIGNIMYSKSKIFRK